MNVPSIDPSIPISGQILGMLVFGSAVLGKLGHREEFIGVVANYRLMPGPLVPAIAWMIVALEILVVACFASGILLAVGAALAVALLCAFAVAMSVNLARGRRDIDCGCFQSSLRQKLSVTLVARNLLLTVAMLPLLAASTRFVSLLQLLDGVAAGVILFVLYETFGRMLALPGPADQIRKGHA